jgi:carboxypeptidase family protein
MKETQFLFSVLFVWISFGMFAGEEHPASLNCAVTDPASAPVANVSATLSSLDRALQAESSTDGQVRFPSVPPGTYGLEVSAAGFAKQKIPLTLSSGDSRTLTILLKVGSVPDMNSCGPHPSIRYEVSDPKRGKLQGRSETTQTRDLSQKLRLLFGGRPTSTRCLRAVLTIRANSHSTIRALVGIRCEYHEEVIGKGR